MRLRVLIDNNTYIDQYYLGEPALGFYIEDEEKRILFDTGYSDALIKNADAMHIDLSKLTHIVISHGHNDHTRGLKYLVEKYDLSNVKLITHPDSMLEKKLDEEAIGSPFDEMAMRKLCHYEPSKVPVKLTEKLYFLGEIPQTFSFEKRMAIGMIHRSDWHLDLINEDSGLVYKSEKGLFIITGCSHCGICNMIEHAKKVCNEERIYGVIGGFHLFKQGTRLEQTIEYFSKQGMEKIYPCHCVSFEAKARINEVMKIEEVGVGLQLEIEE